MNKLEREDALEKMTKASDAFYRAAVHIGNHPFIEFAGLMNEYIAACRAAHASDVDFSECNAHSGRPLPLSHVMSDYINEKLECIFSGSRVVQPNCL